MATFLMHPPGAGSSTITVNGRKYSTTPGTPIPVPDFDAAVLQANGWMATTNGGTGTTVARPLNPKSNTVFYDSTLGIDVVWDGKTWRNKITGAIA
ncbi:hypothetical protein [Paludibacterium purpuratum]|uniref:Uncharacterized protein n=1 Tax=Paludibacterium purpuratum TaxID=1144873 RepID=A0A4R7BEU5_9NEIS|nr:hypothetical protein [Paludibacterium purpuratum]TDR82197.1 hypothetical protein DFP86_102311 [Paludibacterium purpuratum]